MLTSEEESLHKNLTIFVNGRLSIDFVCDSDKLNASLMQHQPKGSTGYHTVREGLVV